MTDEIIAELNCQYSESCGWTPYTDDEAEFVSLFQREPDDYDRRLGLGRVLDIQRSIIELLHS